MIEIGKRYAHYKKGTIYIVLAIGRLEREGMDGEEYVVYRQALAGTEDTELAWIRARSDFESLVEQNGHRVPRFTPVE